MRESYGAMRRHAFLPAALSALFVASCSLRADEYAAYDPGLEAGTRCTVDVGKLRPTQFAVGMKEVQMRIEHIRGMGPKKLEHYLQKRVIPVVIGPGGNPYVLDHHHLARMLLDSALRETAYVEIRENFSRLSEDEFWRKMKEKNWLYLYDENGKGPLDPAQLPRTVKELRDDCYRSLAWAVRERGGYRETDTLFAEFQWANFFRTRILSETVRQSFDSAVDAAMKLVASEEARNLPGFISKPASSP